MKTPHLLLVGVTTAVTGFFACQYSSQAASPLLPFQGRLTDAEGNVVADGARVVQFKIYDAPVGGSAVWNGEVQKLTVNSGLVSTVLGTKANLANVDFDRDLYLELTVDADSDDQITAADPPLLPRQSILQAVFAKEAADSRMLDGYDWSALFGPSVTDPATAELSGSRIAPISIGKEKIAPLTLTSNQMALGSISGDRLASGSLTASQIAPNSIDVTRLAQAVAEALVPTGTIIAFGGQKSALPPGWMLCDGSALQSSDPKYTSLGAVLGTRWGNGSVSGGGAASQHNDNTDFNIPDLRGQFLRGVNHNRTDSYRDPDSSSRVAAFAGTATPNQVGSQQPSQNGAHTHGGEPGTVNTHKGDTGYVNGNLTARAEISGGNNIYMHHRDIINWTSNDSTANASGGLSHATVGSGAIVVGRTASDNSSTSEARPNNAYVNFIIKL